MSPDIGIRNLEELVALEIQIFDETAFTGGFYVSKNQSIHGAFLCILRHLEEIRDNSCEIGRPWLKDLIETYPPLCIP